MSGDVYEWQPPRQGPVADAAINLEIALLGYFENRPAAGEPDPWADDLAAACARLLAVRVEPR
jgi:hypothetical protein